MFISALPVITKQWNPSKQQGLGHLLIHLFNKWVVTFLSIHYVLSISLCLLTLNYILTELATKETGTYCKEKQ